MKDDNKQAHVVLRDFSSQDYDTLALLRNEVHPEYPVTAEDLADADRRAGGDLVRRRWLAEVGSDAVGYGELAQIPLDHGDGRFYLYGGVLEACRRRGIGSALYDAALVAARQHGSRVLCARVKAHEPQAGAFFAKRGFVEAHREDDSELVVADFDPAPLAETARAIEAEGIVIRSLPELRADPECYGKLYKLYWEAASDEPFGAHYSPPPLADWVARNVERHGVPPEGYFVAVKDGQYIGLAHVSLEHATGDLIQGMTGVSRAWRRRGIATALKMRTIEFARVHGHHRIKTGNDSRNESMLALNRRLGFRPTLIWIQVEKPLAD